MPFLDVCALDEIGPKKGLALRTGGRDLALFRVGDEVHAIENACPHAGAALAGGELCGHTLTCPAHGWKFDVTTGALKVAPSMSVPRFPVTVESGRVLVALDECSSQTAAA